MTNIKSYSEYNNEWFIVTNNNIIIKPSVAKEAGRALEIMLSAEDGTVSLECLVSTLNVHTDMRECAEYLTRQADQGMDVDGDYINTLANMIMARA